MAITHSQVIETFIKARDEIKEKEKEAKEWKSGVVLQQGKLIDYFLREIKAKGTTSFKTDMGTASAKTNEYVSIEDKHKFIHFLLGNILMTACPENYKDGDGEWHAATGEHADGETLFKETKEAIIDAGIFEYLSVAANKSTCIQHMNENEGVLPQGLKYTAEKSVTFRRPTKK